MSVRPCLHGNITLIYFPHLQERTEWLSITTSTTPYLTIHSFPGKCFASAVLPLFILTGLYYGQMSQDGKAVSCHFSPHDCSISMRNYKNYMRSKTNTFLWLSSWHSLFFQCHFWTASLATKTQFWIMWIWQPLIRNRWHVYLQWCRWLDLTLLFRRDADATLTQLMQNRRRRGFKFKIYFGRLYIWTNLTCEVPLQDVVV